MWDALVAANADGPVMCDALRSELMESSWSGVFSSSANFGPTEEHAAGQSKGNFQDIGKPEISAIYCIVIGEKHTARYRRSWG